MPMRIPLTKYGLPQVVVFPVINLIAMVVVLAAWPKSWSIRGIILIEILLAAVLVWILSFFRDPERIIPVGKDILLAPADGKVTDIEIVEEGNFIGAPAMRIGIFLSIFNAHINRAPCSVKVESITYKRGKFTNAMNPQSGRVNESNDLALVRTDNPKDKLIVRQISGAIARRIVCEAKQAGQLTAGEKFGMLKFGSRTELYVPVNENTKCLVRIGDKVKAGLTPLVKYETRNK